MFFARRISNLLSAPTAASAHVPAILRSSRSNGATRTHSNRIQWTRDVEVKEIPRAVTVKCGSGFGRGCKKGYYQCNCRRQQIYNGHMKATFVTYASQIASEVPPPPSLTNRFMNYLTQAIVADAALTNAAATVPSVIVDTDTSTITVQRRSKRTRTRSRQLSNDAETIGAEAEDHGVEFEAVDAHFVDQDEEVLEEIVARAPENARMLKEIECSLDGVYWAAIGPRIRRKPDVFVPAM
jgi:hypothetical protein